VRANDDFREMPGEDEHHPTSISPIHAASSPPPLNCIAAIARFLASRSMANGIDWDAANRLVGIGVMTSAIIGGASAGTPAASARRGGLAPALVAAVAAGLQGMAVAALLGGISAAKAENYPTRAIRLLVGSGGWASRYPCAGRRG
jgi:hypothetical protein